VEVSETKREFLLYLHTPLPTKMGRQEENASLACLLLSQGRSHIVVCSSLSLTFIPLMQPMKVSLLLEAVQCQHM